MSRQELAEQINTYLWTHHHRRTCLDGNYIGKLERGDHRWPQALYREALRTILHVSTDADIGFYITRSESPHTWAAPVVQAGAAGQQTTATEAIATALPSERDEVLAHLEQHWHLLVQADNIFGPRHAVTGVETQLTVLRDLLGTDLGRERRQVLALAARYAESAAWLHQDLGIDRRARDWTAQALDWAHQMGDSSMVSWAIYRRSQQQLLDRRPRDAVDLAQAARREEPRLAGPMRAAICVQEAHACAALRRPTEALQLLDQAHTWAVDDRRGDAEAGHGSFCTAGYIEAHRATCLRLLGRPEEAIDVFDRALPTIPAVYRRDRASALASKSAGHLAARQPDIAAATALIALPVARRTGSQRILRRRPRRGVRAGRRRNESPGRHRTGHPGAVQPCRCHASLPPGATRRRHRPGPHRRARPHLTGERRRGSPPASRSRCGDRRTRG